jgi:hypothetical protein
MKDLVVLVYLQKEEIEILLRMNQKKRIKSHLHLFPFYLSIQEVLQIAYRRNDFQKQTLSRHQGKVLQEN